MYPVSEDTIALFQQRYRQVARITLVNSEETLELTESDIVLGGLTVDRYSVSGEKIELGSAIASELTLKLKNRDGQFDDVAFEGAELFVEVGIKDWNTDAEVVYVPMGYFIVDTPPRTLSTITLSALDRMMLFDREVDWDNFIFPLTVAALTEQVCEICGVTIATDLTTLVNYDYELSAAPDVDGATYRNLIQWVAFLTATCAMMDYDGKLVFKWYEQTNIFITPAERYSSDMYENDVVITGLTYTTSWETECTYGTSDYALEINGCSLIQNDIDADGLLPNIYQAIQGFTYRPYEATVKPCPYLFPLDMILYTDSKGTVHETIVTHTMFTLNTGTSIKGSGETTTTSSYNLGSGLTAAESAALEKVINHIVQTKNEILAEVAATYGEQEANAQILLEAQAYTDAAIASLSESISTTYETQTAAAQILADAQSYADSAVSSLEESVSATYETQEAAGQILIDAQSYADSAVSSLSESISATYETQTAAAQILADAKSYSDSAVSSLSESISATYETQTAAAQILADAKSYADSAVSSLEESVSATYETQEASAQILLDAKAYADDAVADLTLLVNKVTAVYTNRNYALLSGGYNEGDDPAWYFTTTAGANYYTISVQDGYTRVYCDTSTTSSYTVVIDLSEDFDPSVQHTISFKIRASSAVAQTASIRYLHTATGTTYYASTKSLAASNFTAGEWSVISYTFTPTSTYYYKQFGFTFTNIRTADMYFDIAYVMVEQGDTVHDWEPAPEDGAALSYALSRLDMLADSISLCVTVDEDTGYLRLGTGEDGTIKFTVEADNFTIDEDGNTAMTGNLTVLDSITMSSNTAFIGGADRVRFTSIVYGELGFTVANSTGSDSQAFFVQDTSLNNIRFAWMSTNNIIRLGNASYPTRIDGTTVSLYGDSIAFNGYPMPELRYGTAQSTVTSSASVTGTVTFASEFSGTPKVLVTVQHNSTITYTCRVQTVSTTDFTYIITSNSSNSTTPSIHWIAMYG